MRADKELYFVSSLSSPLVTYSNIQVVIVKIVNLSSFLVLCNLVLAHKLSINIIDVMNCNHKADCIRIALSVSPCEAT